MPLLLLTSVLAFLGSLAAKLLADTFLVHRVPVLGSFAGLQRIENAGVAFSITFPWHLQGILIGAALALLVWGSLQARSAASRISFGLIIGGALENVADRLRDGVVTDFFQVGTFPVFNVADSCITVGVALLLIEAVVHWWRAAHGGKSRL